MSVLGSGSPGGTEDSACTSGSGSISPKISSQSDLGQSLLLASGWPLHVLQLAIPDLRSGPPGNIDGRGQEAVCFVESSTLVRIEQEVFRLRQLQEPA